MHQTLSCWQILFQKRGLLANALKYELQPVDFERLQLYCARFTSVYVRLMQLLAGMEVRHEFRQNGKTIELPEYISVRDLATAIQITPITVIKKLMSNGMMVTINQQVDYDTAAILMAEFGFSQFLQLF